jgi:hypothetical protein
MDKAEGEKTKRTDAKPSAISLLELPRCEGGKDASKLKAYFFRPGQDARD